MHSKYATLPVMGRIDRLPRPLQAPARALKGRLPEPHPTYHWEGDYMGTDHFSPFLVDEEWARRYEYMTHRWYDEPVDARWRMWVLTALARNCEPLEGAFAEFGSYRGGCAYMILACTRSKPFWLYDTFDGIPVDELTADEIYLSGRYEDTSVEHVREFLSEWSSRIQLVAGDVLKTIPSNDPGSLAFVHLDLNAAVPTRHALEFAYDRVVPAGTIVFDDYGWEGYEAQRAVVDEFFRERPESVTALPTGQAQVIKLPV
jgi:O-methyltransferase